MASCHLWQVFVVPVVRFWIWDTREPLLKFEKREAKWYSWSLEVISAAFLLKLFACWQKLINNRGIVKPLHLAVGYIGTIASAQKGPQTHKASRTACKSSLLLLRSSAALLGVWILNMIVNQLPHRSFPIPWRTISTNWVKNWNWEAFEVSGHFLKLSCD